MRLRRGATGLEVLLALALIHGIGGSGLVIPGLTFKVQVADDGTALSTSIFGHGCTSTLGCSAGSLGFTDDDDLIDFRTDRVLVWREGSDGLAWHDAGFDGWGFPGSFVACRAVGDGDTATHEFRRWWELTGWGDDGAPGDDRAVGTYALKVSEIGEGGGLLPFSMELGGQPTGGAGSASSGVACVAYDAARDVAWGGLLTLRNADRLFDRPNAVSGTVSFVVLDRGARLP